MSDHDKSQQFTMVPLEKQGTTETGNPSAISSTAPVNRPTRRASNASSITTNPGEIPPTQNIRHSFPRFLVLPHLLKRSAWILLAATTLVMIIYIWLYLGAVWSPLTRVKNVEILFYNGDQGFDYSTTPPQVVPVFQTITRNSTLGAFVQSQVRDPNSALSKIVSWKDVSQEQGWDRLSLIDQVEKGKAWGLLYIPANFSNNWLTYAPSTTTGPPTAQSLKPVAMEYVFDQGRNYATHSIVEKYISKSMEALSRGFENQLLGSAANQTLLQVLHPLYWTQPIYMTETILNPVLMYGQNFASYLVFIVQYIGSILAVFSICKYLPTTIETVGVLTFDDASQEPIRKSSQLPKYPALRIVLARNTVAMMFSFLHTIFIWMVPQILHGHQMSEHFNSGIAFAFLWFVGLAFMSTLFFLTHVFTVDGFQIPATMLMILMFTTSTGIMDWIVQPGFYRVGIVFPFTYGVRGMRAIYFGSMRHDMWINWLVIFGWTIIPGLASMVMARSEIRKRRDTMRRTASMAPTVLSAGVV